MTEPIITEADRDVALDLAGDTGLAPVIAKALATARAEGRLAGMEEAARVAEDFMRERDGTNDAIALSIAARIRARTTKEG